MAPLQAMSLEYDAPMVSAVNNHVLYTSSTLKPDMRWEGSFKPGTTDERHSRHGSFTSGSQARARPTGCEPLNLHQQRATPKRGGLVAHQPIWAGGAPRDVRQKSNHTSGTVLYTFPHLARPDTEALYTKPGTNGERVGRLGSFTHGDTHINVKKPADFVVSELIANPQSRRFAGHLPRGAIFRGGAVRV